MRNLLEKTLKYETFGYAGFFGVPASILEYNQRKLLHSYPALIQSCHTVEELPINASKRLIKVREANQTFLTRIVEGFTNLKHNFASPFALIETLGGCMGVLLGFKTCFPRFMSRACQKVKKKLIPQVSSEPCFEKTNKGTGIPFEQRLKYAKAAITSMGIRSFSSVVVLVGHGSCSKKQPICFSA